MYRFDENLRMAWGMPSPNYAAALLAALSLVIAGWLLNHPSAVPRLRMLCWLAALACIWMMTTTYSRGGYAGWAAGLAFLAMKAFRRAGPQGMRARFVTLAGVYVTGAGVFSLFSGFAKRVSPAFLEGDRSIANRLAVWDGASRAVFDGPLFGWGFARSGSTYEDLYQPLGDTLHYLTPVNGWLTVAMEFGPVGMGIVASICAYLPLRFWMDNPPHPSGVDKLVAWVAPAVPVLAVANLFSTLGLGIILPFAYVCLGGLSLIVLGRDIQAFRFKPALLALFCAVCPLALTFAVSRGIAGTSPLLSVDAPRGYEGPIVLRRCASREGEHALLLLDPVCASRLVLRDARRFLASHSSIASCTVVWRAAHLVAGSLTTADRVIAVGDWVKVISAFNLPPRLPITIVYPSDTPESMGFPERAAQVAGVVVAAFDGQGVTPSWNQFAATHRVPLTRADFRDLTSF